MPVQAVTATNGKKVPNGAAVPGDVDTSEEEEEADSDEEGT